MNGIEKAEFILHGKKKIATVLHAGCNSIKYS